jgi:6-phosphogluconolactonase
MKKSLLLSLLPFYFAFTGCIAQKNSRLLIGTYTNGKSEGIYMYEFDTRSGDNTFISTAKASNPSFLAVSPGKKFVYAVTEDANEANDGGSVSAFSLDKKKRKLSLINQQRSGGNHPCYISFDKTGKWAVAANYSGGSFSVFAVNEDGSVAPAATTIRHEGKGINKERQEKAHVHTAVFSGNNKYLLVADLGIDRLMVYDFDELSGKVTANETASVSVSAGSGPRHLSIHPSQKFVYLTEELSGTIGVFNFAADGKLKLLQTISAVPENYKGSLSGADIHVSPDGKFLYASNRGELNDLAIFSIDAVTGILSAVGRQSTLGIKPRNFNFDPSGNFLLAANQESDSIVIFAVDHQTGLLTDTGKRINVPNPVCLQWVH